MPVTPSNSLLPLLTNDALLNRGRPTRVNTDLNRSQSDSALHKNKLPDFLRHRPIFLTRKKSHQTLPLHVVPERPSFEQAGKVSPDKRLPPLPVETINFVADEVMEEMDVQRGNNQVVLRHANTGEDMTTIQLAEDPRRVHLAETNADLPLPPANNESTVPSEIPKIFELISTGEEQKVSKDLIESTPVEVESPPEKVQPPKVVCGLPCDNKRKERELNYTLDVLTGIRSRKDEQKLRAEAKRLEMKKLELKKAAARVNGGMAKRRIL